MPGHLSARVAAIARRFFPWVVIDLPLVWSGYALALLVRGVTTTLEYGPALQFAALASVIVVACNEAFGIYRRWWRFATSQDLVPLTVSVGVATVAIVGLDLAWPGFRPMPLSVVILGGFFALCAMTAVRYRTKPLAAIRRTWHRLVAPPAVGVTRVLIVGAGESGQHLGWQLQNGTLAERHHVVGFVDDDVRKHGMLIHGRQVFGGRQAIPGVVERESIDLIVLAIHTIPGRELREIVSICQETPAQIKSLPSSLAPMETDGYRVSSSSGGPLGDSLFGDLTFEDLLGRHSVQIDREQCRYLVKGKTVLVTGASGSIGSELCRQLAELRPSRLIMLDQNESGVHDLSVELQGFRSDDTTLVPVVGDVTQERRLRALFAGERPHLVFHAAAYKHVPLMEEYPEEAVRVNVGGTRLVMRLSGEFGVERFVLVSSDKAVEPSSVMGATKRVCELLGMGARSAATRYTAVRFGNVLASRGSVVPTFARQIDMGGPITITDPEMSRYFMSISEAASLIVQAATFTGGSDVFLLDMGEEINIADLARRMIRLRGLRPDVDIPIVVTGPRPGEKLREVLHSAEEHTQPTPHPQVVRVLGMRWPLSKAELDATADELLGASADGNRDEVRRLLWQIARDGAAPPTLTPRAQTPGSASTLGAGAALGWDAGGGMRQLSLAGAGPLSGTGVVALPAARAPIQIAADRAREAFRGTADRVLALEPWYTVPLALALLVIPAGTTWPAGLVLAPWLVRWARTGQLLAPTPLSVPIGLFAAGGVIGMLVTSNPIQGGIRLNGLLAAIALFWLIVHHATTLKGLRRALGLAILASAIGSLLMLVISAPYLPWGAPGGPLSGLIAATDPFRQFVLGSPEALQRYRFRASGVGALATFGLALALGPALVAARRKARLACFTLVLAFLAVIVASGSRSSLVSVAALLVVLVGLRYRWLLLAVPFVLVGLWVLVEQGPPSLGAPDALPLAVKMTFWQNAAAMLHDFAFTGVGLGQRSVRDAYEAHMLAIGPTFSHAHNAFIQAYLEQGLLGCVGLVSLTLVLLFNAQRAVANARTPLAWGVALSGGGAAIVQLFEGMTEVVLLTSVGNVLLLVALGLLVAAGRIDRRAIRGRQPLGAAPERGLTRLIRPIVTAPLAAGLLLVGLITFTLTPLASPLFLNLGAVERVRAVLTDGLHRDDRAALLSRSDGFLRRALNADDRDAAIWRNLAEVSLAQGEVGRAREYLAEARDRTSFGDAYALYQLGRISRDAGLWREAAFAWREARAAAALQAWAQEARSREQWERASVALGALAELRPNDPEPFQQLVQATRRTPGGVPSAIAELERLAEAAPRSQWPLVELATLYDEQGESAKAAAARQHAQQRAAQSGS